MNQILVIPNVFTKQFCDVLVDKFEHYAYGNGGVENGVADFSGNNSLVRSHKYRLDWFVRTDWVRYEIRKRLIAALLPVVEKTYDLVTPQEIERCLISKYPTGGFFDQHRDNANARVYHRNFGFTIQLNEDFEGGELRFPEYDAVPKFGKGDAVVFPAYSLHELTHVVDGERYAFLSFLYDKALFVPPLYGYTYMDGVTP